MKAIRIFYKKSDNQIVWTHALEGGEFPYSIKKYVDMTSEINKNDYVCLEVIDETTIDNFMASDSNKIKDGKLVIGLSRPTIIPEPTRDLAAEIDQLKAKIADIEKATGIGSSGQKGIAQRIDNLETRIIKLEI